MPTTAHDRDAIRDLVARFSQCVDTGAAQAWAELFTDDGEMVIGGTSVVGRDALQALASEQMRAGAVHHLDTNEVIDVNGDTARVRSSVLVIANGAVLRAGRYTDDLRRIDGRWMIARRAYVRDTD